MRLAPVREVIPVGTISADRRGRAGTGDEGIGLSNQLLEPARRGNKRCMRYEGLAFIGIG